jgi:hypothetical protein
MGLGFDKTKKWYIFSTILIIVGMALLELIFLPIKIIVNLIKKRKVWDGLE